jgi:hypothetical protein
MPDGDSLATYLLEFLVTFVVLILATACCTFAESPNVQYLLRTSVANTERNWKQSPDFAFTEHDINEKLDSKGDVKSKTDKTYEVTMLDGSPYQRLIAVNGEPLASDEAKAEYQKFVAERQRRGSESRYEQNKRIAKYEKERRQDQAMLREMAEAFNYTLDGEQTIDGRLCYVLTAAPKPGYVPKTRDTKVLTGMRGKLWIDKAELQWVKVEAEVMRPVSFYAVATVYPGTRFELEQEPVGGGVWMARHFSVRVNSAVLWFSRNSFDESSYSSYRRVAGEAARTGQGH